MGKEVKISLALVGVLVIILVAVLGRGLLRRDDVPPADADTEIAASDTEASDAEPDNVAGKGTAGKGAAGKTVKPALASSGGDLMTLEKPTFIAAQPRTRPDSPKPSGKNDGVGPFRFVTRNDSSATATQSTPPTMMPRLPKDEESGYRTAAVPGRPSVDNPFPAQPRPVDSAETAARRPDPPSAPGGAVAPYRRYGGEAGTADSYRGVPPAPDDRSNSRHDLPSAPVGYDRYPPYRGAGSENDTSRSVGGTRFQATSSRADLSYRTGSRAPSTTGGYSTPAVAPRQTEPGKVTVQPNDSFWRISERLYGSGAYFRALAEHNRKICPNPHRLQTGTVIDAPEASELRERFPNLCPSAEREQTRRHRESIQSTGLASSHGRVYVVQAGDTLYDIARYELDDASRWGEIVSLNRDQLGNDYDYLTPGMKLVLPTGTGESFQPAQQLSRPAIRTATPPRSDAYQRY